MGRAARGGCLAYAASFAIIKGDNRNGAERMSLRRGLMVFRTGGRGLRREEDRSKERRRTTTVTFVVADIIYMVEQGSSIYGLMI